MIERLKKFIGNSINHTDIQEYILENRIKAPKKQKISWTSHENDSVFFEDKVNGVEVEFTIRPLNPNIQPSPSDRKGTFYPVCDSISIKTAKGNKDSKLPFNLKWGMTAEEVQKELLILPPSNLNRTESDKSRVSFSICDESNENIMYYFSLTDDRPLNRFKITSEIWKYSLEIFTLRDSLGYFNHENQYQAAPFIEWAIKENLFVETDENKEGIALVKNNVITGLSFINRYVKHAYIYIGDFLPEVEEFIRDWHFNHYSELLRNVYKIYGYINPQIIVHEMHDKYLEYKKSNAL